LRSFCGVQETGMVAVSKNWDDGGAMVVRGGRGKGELGFYLIRWRGEINLIAL
jgi:hypothetical protein